MGAHCDTARFKHVSRVLIQPSKKDKGLNHHWSHKWSCKPSWENEQKRNVVVVVLDRKGNPVAKYELTGAWPSSWRLGRLDGLLGSPLLEELVLQYEKLDVEYLKPSTQ